MAEPVNIHVAKTHLSRLVERVEAGEEIVIARAGRPIARLVPLSVRTQPRKLGHLQDRVVIGPDFDASDADVTEDFEADDGQLRGQEAGGMVRRPKSERPVRIGEALSPYMAPMASGSGPSDVDMLPAIVGRIVRLIDPERVVLFGSRATGLASGDSDYDILVVVEELPKRRETRVEISRSLADLGAAIDVLVAARPELDAGRRGPRGIVQWAAEQGRVVYERA